MMGADDEFLSLMRDAKDAVVAKNQRRAALLRDALLGDRYLFDIGAVPEGWREVISNNNEIVFGGTVLCERVL